MSKKTLKNKDKTIYGTRGWQPTYFAFCSSKKAWKNEMKKLGIKLRDNPYPESAGCCTSLCHPEYGTIALVTINEEVCKDRSSLEIVGLLVHEASHVIDYIFEVMGEKEPSSEFKAYGIQVISQDLIAAYEQSRGKLTK